MSLYSLQLGKIYVCGKIMKYMLINWKTIENSKEYEITLTNKEITGSSNEVCIYFLFQVSKNV